MIDCPNLYSLFLPVIIRTALCIHLAFLLPSPLNNWAPLDLVFWLTSIMTDSLISIELWASRLGVRDLGPLTYLHTVYQEYNYTLDLLLLFHPWPARGEFLGCIYWGNIKRGQTPHTGVWSAIKGSPFVTPGMSSTTSGFKYVQMRFIKTMFDFNLLLSK